MNEIRLTGLIGSHPLGALAAFGLLRVSSQIPDLGEVRLAWERENDWIAVLQVGLNAARDELPSALVRALMQRQCGRAGAPFLTWNDDVKVEPAEYARLLATKQHECQPTEREVVDFLAAFGSEAIKARSTGDVKPTAFHMTAGQQKFLKSVRELAGSLDPRRVPSRGETPSDVASDTREAFGRALFGPWKYGDECHAMGWDPATEALHALSGRAPTDAKPHSERAAVWLAFEALPLFPTAPDGKRLVTRAFDERASFFSWPIWCGAISVNTLASLLALPDLVASEPPAAELRHRGIVALYRSRCERDANGRGTFRNAQLCFG